MARKASVFRLEEGAHAALTHLSRLLGRPINGLVNDAVRQYLSTAGQQEREVEGTLASLRHYRRSAAPVRSDGETAALDAAREFVRRASSRYPVKTAMLFGSRARRTHRVDSDVDIAVLLSGQRGDFMATSLALADIAFEVLLDTQVYVQPVPIWEEEWEHPENHSNPRLIEAIQLEGTCL